MNRIFDNLRLGTKLNLFVLLVIVCVAAGGVGIAAAVQHESSRQPYRTVAGCDPIRQERRRRSGKTGRRRRAYAPTGDADLHPSARDADLRSRSGLRLRLPDGWHGRVLAGPQADWNQPARYARLAGRPVAREIRDSATKTGEGVVDHPFPRVGETTAIPKLSYATTFPAWDMFLGSGSYIDDLNAKFRSAVLGIGAGVGLLALLIGGAAWFVSRRITRPLDRLQGCMRRLAEGEIDLEIPDTARRDEVGTMAQAVEVFKRNAVEHRRLEAEAAASRAQGEAERERAAMERAKAAEEQAEVVRQLGDGLKTLAAGDLTIRLGDSFAAAYAQIRHDFNEAVDKLKETLVSRCLQRQHDRGRLE